MDLKLTKNQQKFADEYIKTGNASEAYREAGYKAKGEGTIRATYYLQALGYSPIQAAEFNETIMGYPKG